MKWVEFIRVRSSEATLRDALPSLEHHAADISRDHDGADASVLRHALYDGDLAVVIVWRTDSDPKESLPGLMVAQSLARLGSVDHSVWCPHHPLTAQEHTP